MVGEIERLFITMLYLFPSNISQHARNLTNYYFFFCSNPNWYKSNSESERELEKVESQQVRRSPNIAFFSCVCARAARHRDDFVLNCNGNSVDLQF